MILVDCDGFESREIFKGMYRWRCGVGNWLVEAASPIKPR